MVTVENITFSISFCAPKTTANFKKENCTLGQRIHRICIRFFNYSTKVNRRKGRKVHLCSGRESFAIEKKAPCDRTAAVLLSIRRESLRGINQRLL